MDESARWITHSTKVAIELARVHQSQPLDVVDFPEWAGEGYVYLINRSEWNETAAIVHIHGPLAMLAETISWPPKDSHLYEVGMHMEGASLRAADGVISSSACSRDWCARLHGIDANDVEVVHLGVDLEEFKPPTERRSGRRIVFVGRLAPSKGVEHLVEAVRSLAPSHEGLELVLVGRGEPDHVDRLRGRLADSRATLEVVGHVDRSELPSILGRADVLAAPSLYEGGPGLVFLEAMACGVPVIASAAGGAGEIVRPGENGFLVPPADVDAIAGAIDALISVPELARKLGDGGRRFVEEHADTRNCVARLEQVYRGALDRKRVEAAP